MTTVNGKWLRLVALIGCTSWLVSCKQAAEAPSMPMTYAVMKVATTDSKAFTTNYSASIQGRQDIDIYPQVSGFLERL